MFRSWILSLIFTLVSRINNHLSVFQTQFPLCFMFWRWREPNKTLPRARILPLWSCNPVEEWWSGSPTVLMHRKVKSVMARLSGNAIIQSRLGLGYQGWCRNVYPTRISHKKLSYSLKIAFVFLIYIVELKLILVKLIVFQLVTDMFTKFMIFMLGQCEQKCL